MWGTVGRRSNYNVSIPSTLCMCVDMLPHLLGSAAEVPPQQGCCCHGEKSTVTAEEEEAHKGVCEGCPAVLTHFIRQSPAILGVKHPKM